MQALSRCLRNVRRGRNLLHVIDSQIHNRSKVISIQSRVGYSTNQVIHVVKVEVGRRRTNIVDDIKGRWPARNRRSFNVIVREFDFCIFTSARWLENTRTGGGS